MRNLFLPLTTVTEKLNCRKKKIDIVVDSTLYNSDKAYQQTIDETLKKVIR